jgi:hypothetical protein
MVAQIFWLIILVIVLVIAGARLVRYVAIPLALLRVFFRSKRVPRGLKEVVCWTLSVFALLLLGSLGCSRHLQE